MDEKTQLLISLGASTAANCVPCFEYYFQQATKLGLDLDDIEQAVAIGDKVKTGASIAMTKSIRLLTGRDAARDGGDGASSDSHPCRR